MAHIIADRIRDTTTTTGTGAFTLADVAPSTYRTFDAVCANNDTIWYAAIHRTANEWEVGLGTSNGSTTLTRTTILAGSNGTSAVNFSAGTKDVIAILPDAAIDGTTAEYLANTANRLLMTDRVNAAGALFALTDASTVTVDMANGFNFSLLTTSGVGASRTLGNPTNTIVGRTGVIVVTQDGSGSRTLSYGTSWEAAGGTFPVLSTAAGAKDAIFYWVQSSTSIIITGILKGLA